MHLNYLDTVDAVVEFAYSEECLPYIITKFFYL